VAASRRDPVDPAELERFRATFMYHEPAILVDEIVGVDREARLVEARLDTGRELPFAAQQRIGPGHPAHVSGAELVMVTAALGCLHAWLFHGCRWDEGWTGFGSRIHRADFRRLARLGPPLELESVETRTRVGPRRVVLRIGFTFRQDGAVVYTGDQSAMFVRGVEPA
jgi:hypothetical protein